MDDRIQNAQELFEEKKYNEALSTGLDLIEEGIDKKDAALICAKAFLFLSKPPLEEKDQERFSKLIEVAFEEAKTVEEALRIEKEICEAISKWKEKSVKSLLATIQRNPTFDQWKKYLSVLPEFISLEIRVRALRSIYSVVNAYCEENGIKVEELTERFPDEIPKEDFTSEDIHTLEFRTAKKIFNKAKADLAECAHSNSEYLVYCVKRILQAFMVAELVAGYSAPKKGTDDGVRCERLKLEAEIIDYYLNALTYPNGREVSLVQGDSRAKDVSKLEELYAEIEEYDASFEPPMLPDVIAKAQTGGGNTGGGCYVATAVYGSYDCPEVWTLRRFRDYILAETWYGRAFIRLYYAVSPTLVKWFGKTAWFRNIWKPFLDRTVENLNKNGIENTHYSDKAW